MRILRSYELAVDRTTFGSVLAVQVAFIASAPEPVATSVTSRPVLAIEPAKARPLS